MHERKIVITNDGSHTIFDPVLKSHFHSIHGAITESKHVFIKHGLETLIHTKPVLRIFEFGFGTGLNAYLSFLKSLDCTTELFYQAIDSNPLELELAQKLNYSNWAASELATKSFMDFHSCPWNQWNTFHNRFSLYKMQIEWESLNTAELFDLVYFDAFDPVCQPELWDLHSFERIYNMMSIDSVLCTYCAKGVVRRNLKEVGFRIESLPGPPGKREMTRAIKTSG